jgi:lysine-N-methylase
MKLSRIEIPELQNWSCHGCSDCCRGALLIKISAEEKEQIEKQKWTAADGVDPASMIVKDWNYFRLGHQSNGACVFLDAAGRCRIHAKFGEAAKPLACRLYPLVIHPAGGKLVVGLRFSCPSAAANKGKALTERGVELRELAREVVPRDFDEGPPPAIVAAPPGEWADFHRFVKWLDASLFPSEVPMALKLLRALHWLDAVEKGSLDRISGEGAEEILSTLVTSAGEKLLALPENPPEPSRFGKIFFRMMVVEHARAVTVQDMLKPGQYRWRMLRAIFRFLPASGSTPALREDFKSVKFAEIEKPFGALTPEMEASLTRFFRVKIQSLHFCGRAFHGAPLIEGFRSLALLFPLVVWLGRWRAIGAGRSSLTLEDLERAITLVDYHHGYSPYQRWRLKLLTQRGDIARLVNWYSR